MKFQENNDIGCMYKQWFKNKVKQNRGHITFPWIWGLTLLHGERALQLPVKYA
jgi:hypothetical protein